MRTIAIVLAVLSCVLAAWGLMMLTQATNGVGAIALACFVAILARLAQASAHQAAAIAALTKASMTISGPHL